jgi:hypothetical protein
MDIDEFILSVAMNDADADINTGLDFDIDEELTKISKKSKTSKLSMLDRFMMLKFQQSLLQKYEKSMATNSSSEKTRQLRLHILYNKVENILQK